MRILVVDDEESLVHLAEEVLASLGYEPVGCVGANEARRAALDEQFAVRTAEDVARELGNMKGAIMKAGQLIGFMFELVEQQAHGDVRELLGTAENREAILMSSLEDEILRSILKDRDEQIVVLGLVGRPGHQLLGQRLEARPERARFCV